MRPLHALFEGLDVGPMPPENPKITGLHHDSRRIHEGDLFVAIVGERFDGRRFFGEAEKRGAAAVIGPPPAPEKLRVPWVSAADPRLLLGPLAARLYGNPHEKLKLVGVTGTNGKGTVTRLVMRIFEAAGLPAGIGGTLGYHFAGRDYCGDLDSSGGPRTTLEASELFRVLNEMADAGARAMAMEVSSHGLEMHRVAGLEFDVGVFTNLSRDHLDFHGDLESYFQAKRRLFSRHLRRPERAVVFAGDAWARRLRDEIRAEAGRKAVLTCAEDEGDVHLVRARLDLGGIEARVSTPRGEIELRSKLLGRFNLWNLLTAVAVAEALELPQRAVREGIAAELPMPGRMEPVRCGQNFPALVDYAHTPVGIEAALGSLRELSERKILVVFGCGGDRDRGKRPEMGRAAGDGADFIIVTSDNPRHEDPEAVLDDIEPGLRRSGSAFLRIADRRTAIRKAVEMAAGLHEEADWVVLVAGKGHEALQILGDRRLPFSDRQELKNALAQHGFTDPGEEGLDG